VDEEGRKMSKSAGNILDPWELIGSHGADAMRWLMLAEGNPWVSRRVGHHVLEDVIRRFVLTLWNTHVFFTTYAAIDGFDLDVPAPAVADRPASDRWVLAELAELVDTVDAALDRYDVSTATRRLERFVDDLSNWYVRRNRRRFWKAAADDPQDKAAAYHTLHACLTTVAQLLAPFTPFLADRLWHDLVVTQRADAAVSVHLTDFPTADEGWRDEPLRAAMATARRVVELGRQARNDAAVKVRQPLARALVIVPEPERKGLALLLDEIADELNVKQVELADGTGDLVDRSLKPNFRALGPVFQQRAPRVAEAIRTVPSGEAGAIAAALAAGGDATLEVDGEAVSVTADMVEVVETPRTGWAVAAQGATSFALDTELDRALEVEGAARELIRAVNDRRKAAGLALDDRIELTVAVSPPELDAELEAGGHYDVVAREVLAAAVRREPPTSDAVRVDLGDLGAASISVQR
jgi:isoleucyl-tRNA synthetase